MSEYQSAAGSGQRNAPPACLHQRGRRAVGSCPAAIRSFGLADEASSEEDRQTHDGAYTEELSAAGGAAG